MLLLCNLSARDQYQASFKRRDPSPGKGGVFDREDALKLFLIKETRMNAYRHTQGHVETTPLSETIQSEEDVLAQWGFSADEIASLLWLRQWYQTGGSDRAVIIRHLAFLRLLVRSGELEL